MEYSLSDANTMNCNLEKKMRVVIKEKNKLPPSAFDGKCAADVEEIQFAYRILNLIKHGKIIKPFYREHKPGVYKKLKVPITFIQVKKKLNAGKYRGLADFIKDIRLLFEFSFKFLGPHHQITLKGLRTERKLERFLQELPRHILNNLHGYEKMSEEHKNNNVLNKTSAKKLAKMQKLHKKMTTWEKKHIVTNETTLHEIRSMWELAEIGSFLRLTCRLLHLREITQYEVERMLLMPRESMTLTKIMSSLLCPKIQRLTLNILPMMPYSIWTEKLKKKIDVWLELSRKINDPVVLFEETGIEPMFWQLFQNLNPLNQKFFHEISFCERVIIIKSLCDNIFHTNANIRDAFNESENMQQKHFRHKYLGEDSGDKYVSLSFIPEIRIYKEMKSKATTQCNSIIQKPHVSCSKIDQLLHIDTPLSSKIQFCIVSDDLDSLAMLIDQLKSKKRFALVSELNILYFDASSYQTQHEGLTALYQQWHEYQNRGEIYQWKYNIS